MINKRSSVCCCLLCIEVYSILSVVARGTTIKMTLTDEEKEKYENEFSEFLIQRIKNLGGSLQFQYLTSLLPQLSFEVKSAVGSSKVQLMKFLKSHSRKFKVDSKGIVTTIDTSAAEDDHSSDDDSTMVPVKSSLPSTIQNGKGRISKLHSEFGFIRAIEPIKTTVYFRAPQFSGDKDDLLAEYDLQTGLRVCFNAVMGHSDCDVKYRATKVWREIKNSNDEDIDASDLRQGNLNDKVNDSPAKFDNKLGKHKEAEEENLNGEGVIQKVFQQMGFISVAGGKKDTVYFCINDLEDFDGTDLTKILKTGDGVEFVAKKTNRKDSKAKWQAITVSKKFKKNKQKNEEKYISSDTEEMQNRSSKSRSGNKDPHSVIDDNYKGSRKEMLKDERGKISILSNGINITFGEKFTKIANGDSATYFLYGEKVTDIPWEFSDGDEVHFDAVKIKAEPCWKAVLVWVGEKPDYVLPTCLGDFSEFTDEELDEIPEGKNYSRSKNSSSSEKSVRTNTRSYKIEEPGKKKNVGHDHSKQKFENKSDRDYRKQNLRSLQGGSQSNMSVREPSKQKQGKEPQIKDAAFNRFKGKQNPAPNRRVNYSKDHQNKSYSQNISHQNLSISENSDNEIEDQDDELQTVSKFLNSPHKNGKFNRKSLNQSEVKTFTTFSESEADDSEHNEKVSEYKKKNYGKSSIKKFQSINGKVTKVNCKFAFAQNPDLQEKIHFFSNVFYNNGQSVEEQQVDDLREVISSGVTVNLNCFEIVDDCGDIHHKVTMAWLGEQPKISEITPEEFIEENNLSVTIKDESDKEDVAAAKNAPKKFLFVARNSDSENEIEGCASPMKFSSSENASDDETSLSSKCSKTSENKEHQVFLKTAESSIDYKLLSEIVSQQLESKGLLYPDSEVNLNSLSAEIVDVIVQRHHSTKASGNRSIELHSTGYNHVAESVCSHCAKTMSGTSSNQNSKFDSKEVQTIITGEIVAQSKFFTGKKKK